MAQPGSADFRTVCTKSGSRIAPEVASLARIAEGGGSSTKGMPAPTQTISHRANTVSPNSSGDRMSRRPLSPRFGIDPASLWFSHQAPAQAARVAIQNTAGTAAGRACAQPIRAANAAASTAAATAFMAALP